ncbi:mechanosensitive ion channel protein MscS [Microbulbifer flavimaris]|uniref:Mechanosensitive ion channel protein MscS n=1 Tax=Microbulbifer flavimaris TaxID=1781068 RepID=A0ABX4HY43_9GAMM|nr:MULTISPECIES: mechanosensitive ion channel domain-containing protein [Microbulbifer]PCO04976.1 mechanosensitive ion channel protein MscS [Microbulbifer flavimaris]
MQGGSGFAFLSLTPSCRSRRCQWLHQASSLVLAFLLTFFSLSAFAQLPGGKPKEFEPVIPDFSAPTADWWTGWPDATREQRQAWRKELVQSWMEWSGKLPENKELQEQVAAVNDSFKRLNVTWTSYEELKSVAVLPEVEFPSEPTVLDWQKADAAIARGQQRLQSLQLEVRQIDEALSQSLRQLRNRVVALRDAEAGTNSEIAALKLFRTQVDHLNIIEQRSLLEEQMSLWQEQVELAENQLDTTLQSLVYSEKAQQSLGSTLEELKEKRDAMVEQRAELQRRALESTDPQQNLEQDLQLMENEISQLENLLRQRKSELLQSMNSVLNPDGEDPTLVRDRDLVETARTTMDAVSRDLNLRQRQVVAWSDEERGAMRTWWRRFEKIDSALGRAEDLLEDVLRYESAQLQVFQQRRGWWATLRERAGHLTNVAYTHWRELADYQLFTISQSPVTLRILARVLFVLICAWLISGFTRRFLNRLVRKEHASESSMYTLGRVLHYSIIGIALLVALVMLGLDASKLALVAGALSVGIGFGLQAIFSNFISGLILLFEQPLRVGDLVELESGVFGRIRDINVRSTRITTRDNVDILVPNSEFVAGRVINHTLDDPVRRIHVPFGVAYGSDPDEVREAAAAAAERVSITHTDWQRKTEVWLMEFADSALNFKLVVWINSNMVSPLGDPYALYNVELLREFNDRGIEIPFPQRDLHLRSWDAPLTIARRNSQ